MIPSRAHCASSPITQYNKTILSPSLSLVRRVAVAVVPHGRRVCIRRRPRPSVGRRRTRVGVGRRRCRRRSAGACSAGRPLNEKGVLAKLQTLWPGRPTVSLGRQKRAPRSQRSRRRTVYRTSVFSALSVISLVAFQTSLREVLKVSRKTPAKDIFGCVTRQV